MSLANQPSARLLEHFKNLEDPRTEYLLEHQGLDIIGLTICAVICGADTWVDIENYGRAKQEWLKGCLSLSKGIAAHDTLARWLAALNPTALQECFLSGVKAVAQLSQGEVMAIEGKTLRHSYDTGGKKGAIHIVSAWTSQNRLVLGQLKVDEKSHEITAIAQLLKVLELPDCIVTIDAMGCQKDIMNFIRPWMGGAVASKFAAIGDSMGSNLLLMLTGGEDSSELDWSSLRDACPIKNPLLSSATIG